MIRDFEHIPIKECGEPLVDLATFGFVLEPMYFKRNISLHKEMFLRESAAKRLMEVQKSLDGFKIKIWDGFREYSTQKILFDTFRYELKSLHPDWSDEQSTYQDTDVRL